MNTRDCPHGRQTGKCADCDVARLEAENEALRKDAERYRWLFSCGDDISKGFVSAIDAAMKGTP